MLDLWLPCCEEGRIDSFCIHEPFDEIESLCSSTGGGIAVSPFIKGCRRDLGRRALLKAAARRWDRDAFGG